MGLSRDLARLKAAISGTIQATETEIAAKVEVRKQLLDLDEAVSDILAPIRGAPKVDVDPAQFARFLEMLTKSATAEPMVSLDVFRTLGIPTHTTHGFMRRLRAMLKTAAIEPDDVFTASNVRCGAAVVTAYHPGPKITIGIEACRAIIKQQ